MTLPLAEVSKYFGDGSNYKNMWKYMNPVNKYARALKAAVDSGADPMSVNFNGSAAQGGKSIGAGNQQHFWDLFFTFTIHDQTSFHSQTSLTLEKP